MKLGKLIVAACVMGISVAAIAAQNDVLLSFSTKGPDKYADGSTVKDGEAYALVWVKTGATFAGVTADAKAVDTTNNVLLCAAPLAKDGRCPETHFEINAKLAEGYSNGTYHIFLLDTRRADGSLGGIQKGVNGLGEVASYSAATGDGDISAPVKSANEVASAITATAIPAGAPRPVIKSIEIRNGKAYITVEKTISSLKYNLAVGTEVGAAEKSAAADAPKDGTGSLTQTITLEADATAGQQFFKVERDPLTK